MAVFTYNEETIFRMVRRIKRVRIWLSVISVVWLVVDLLTAFGVLRKLGIDIRLHGPCSNAVFVLPFVMLCQSVGGWKPLLKTMADHLRAYSVDVSPYSVRIQYGLMRQRQFSREEILRAEEPSMGAGLYLRSPNRYRSILIPRRIDGYSEIKAALQAQGIPFVGKAIPGNWEDFAFVFLFCGSLLCPLLSQTRLVLELNLLVATLIGVAGFYVISANPDNMPRMRWTRFATFLPLIFAALTFFML